MDRSPAFLAALASAAVPGLDPVSVEALPSTDDQSFDVAFVQDAEHRRWVVRAPRSDVAGAEMDRTVALLGLLGRRLPFAVPAPKGFVALSEGGRAAVYPYLPGHNLDFAELPPGPGIAAELGRAIAALHNTDPAVYDEAGLPSYDADAYRSRRLADLDRAAETGRVPTTLLTRWETALEDVSLWRFAPTATHGDLTGDQVLAVFTDDADAATGKIRAVTGWEDAKVADPADDFAALVADARPEAVETVLEAYSHTRVERPDPNLLVRARLVAELGLLGTMMVALARKDDGAVEVLTTQLRRLDDAVHASEEPDDYRRTSLAPVGVRRRTTRPPAMVVDDDDEDLPVVEADEADAAGRGRRRGRPGCRGERDRRGGCRGARGRRAGHRGARGRRRGCGGRGRRDRAGCRERRRRGRRRGHGGGRGRPGDDRARPQAGRAARSTRVISSAPGRSGHTVSPVAAWKNAPRTRASGTPRTRAHASR